MVTLGGLNRFKEPVFTEDLQEQRQSVLEVADNLQAAHSRPTYFPFYLYRGNQLRAQQGYLVKFPIELFKVWPRLHPGPMVGSDQLNGELTEESREPGDRVGRGRVTRVQDPELRAAIENHAVDRAIEYFEKAGGTNFLKLGKPYDIRLTLEGIERHVEVKGSSLSVETVELTINEVRHAENYQPTDLIVVDGILYHRTSDGVTTSGGRLRIWRDWKPLDADLDPRKFAYTLTDDS